LAPKATHTVLALADTPERDTRESEPRRSVSPPRGSSSAAGLTSQVSRTTLPWRPRWSWSSTRSQPDLLLRVHETRGRPMTSDATGSRSSIWIALGSRPAGTHAAV